MISGHSKLPLGKVNLKAMALWVQPIELLSIQLRGGCLGYANAAQAAICYD